MGKWLASYSLKINLRFTPVISNAIVLHSGTYSYILSNIAVIHPFHICAVFFVTV